jgi:hypothetical protein
VRRRGGHRSPVDQPVQRRFGTTCNICYGVSTG